MYLVSLTKKPCSGGNETTKVSADGSGVYVGGELGGLIHLARNAEDGSLTMTRGWSASEFDEALQVNNPQPT